jgi:hypothetical protein
LFDEVGLCHENRTSGKHRYVNEPAGTVEYFGPDGQIIETVTAASQRAVYLDWCQREGIAADPRILG